MLFNFATAFQLYLSDRKFVMNNLRVRSSCIRHMKDCMAKVEESQAIMRLKKQGDISRQWDGPRGIDIHET